MLVLRAEESASELLNSNLDSLHSLASALLKHEVLDDSDIDCILEGKLIEGVRAKSLEEHRDEVKAGRPEGENGHGAEKAARDQNSMENKPQESGGGEPSE